MSTIITNPPPKKRFQAVELFVKQHREMVQSDVFERAVDFALLQFQSQLSDIELSNFNLAAGAHLRMMGAQEFVKILRTLCESPTPAVRQKLDDLNHEA